MAQENTGTAPSQYHAAAAAAAVITLASNADPRENKLKGWGGWENRVISPLKSRVTELQGKEGTRKRQILKIKY